MHLFTLSLAPFLNPPALHRILLEHTTPWSLFLGPSASTQSSIDFISGPSFTGATSCSLSCTAPPCGQSLNTSTEHSHYSVFCIHPRRTPVRRAHRLVVSAPISPGFSHLASRRLVFDLPRCMNLIILHSQKPAYSVGDVPNFDGVYNGPFRVSDT